MKLLKIGISAIDLDWMQSRLSEALNDLSIDESKVTEKQADEIAEKLLDSMISHAIQ